MGHRSCYLDLIQIIADNSGKLSGAGSKSQGVGRVRDLLRRIMGVKMMNKKKKTW